MANDPVRILRCPMCRKPVVWSPDSPHRPFCSARCRLIDLGEWANEEKRIPADDNVQVDDDVSSQDEP